MIAFSPTFRRCSPAAMAGAAMMTGVCAGLAAAQDTYRPASGPAIDWSILANLSESLRLENNSRLNGDNDGIEATGILGVGLTVSGRGKRTQFEASTGLTLGRSTDNTIGNLDRIDPNIAATAVFLGKGYSVNASVNASTRATSVSELEGSGVTNSSARRFDAGASVGVSWDATKRDTLSLSTSAQLVDFSRSGGTFSPSQTIGLSGNWSRRATETTTLSLATSFSHFNSDGLNGRTSRTVSAQLGVQHQRTSRHNLGGSAGVSLISTNRSNQPSTTNFSFVGGGSFGYTKDEFGASLDLTQSVRPSADGDLNVFSSLSGRVGYRINDLESLGFDVSYTRRADLSGGDVLQFVTFGPSYSLSLSKNSSLSLGYRFRLRDDADNDFENGHQFMLTLSHALSLLP